MLCLWLFGLGHGYVGAWESRPDEMKPFLVSSVNNFV